MEANVTDIKQKDLIKKLERAGFVLIRKSKHIIYRKNGATVCLPHHKVIKRKTHKDIQKIIESVT